MYDIRKTHSVEHISHICSAGAWEARSLRLVAIAIMAALSLTLVAARRADAFFGYNNGPIMENCNPGDCTVKAYLIFWPGSNHFAPGTNGDIVFQTTIARFFQDLGGSDYFDIAAQYTGPCNGSVAPISGPCSPGPVSYGGSWIDPTPYDPQTVILGDFAIPTVIQRARQQNPDWGIGLGAEYFVFFPAGVKVCNRMGFCSDGNLCAWHHHFSLDNTQVIYAAMPQIHSAYLAGNKICGLNFSSLPLLTDWAVMRAPFLTPNQLDADWEIVGVSHELFESITDPLYDTNPAWTGPEIGDNCGGMVGNALFEDGGNVICPTEIVVGSWALMATSSKRFGATFKSRTFSVHLLAACSDLR